MKKNIPGTYIFNGDAAKKGYALNKMCFSFNEESNRNAFVADEKGYCEKFGLNTEQTEAILNKDILELIHAGGNAYYLGKFAGVFDLDMQDIGALQTGMTKEDFKAMLLTSGK